MVTQSGRQVYLLNPLPEDIVLEDIVVALANTRRFAGHAPITVAQHSLDVRDDLFAARHGLPQYSPVARARISLYALLHDAHEAYIGDITQPCARVIAALAGVDVLPDLKERVQGAIHRAFGLDEGSASSSWIKVADERRLVREAVRYGITVAPPAWNERYVQLARELAAVPDPCGAVGPMSADEAARRLRAEIVLAVRNIMNTGAPSAVQGAL
jgi:hypothetical protein